MKIAFVTTRPDKASFKFRVVQYLPYIKQKGLQYDILILPRDLWSRQLFFSRLKDYDVIFWQKRLLGRIDLWKLKRNSRYLIYDFDDSVMYNDAKNGNFSSYRLAHRFQNMVAAADHVIAGNEFLAEKAGRHTNSDKIRLIPSVVDLNIWKLKDFPHHTLQDIIVGWVGSQSTLSYWTDKLPIWKQISRKYPHVIFKVICDNTEKSFSAQIYKDFRFEAIEWTEEEQVRNCADIDIGIMPLPDNPWTRGKCGFKLIQYLSLGKAAVASPVGVNSNIISQGKTGLLADTDEEWINSLSLLIENSAKRLELGTAAYRHIQENYSLQTWCEAFLRTLQHH